MYEIRRSDIEHNMSNREKNECILIGAIISVLVIFAVFLKSYFPSKNAVEGYADFHRFPNTLESSVNLSTSDDVLKPLYGRLVFVLIDALRRDFVMAHNSAMVFTSDLIGKNQARLFTAKAHPPTVTLPRIKALTTGGIPGFVDVVLNFGSTALQEDNLITQMKQHNKRLVFYGDDTWLRLFPDHFIRSEGTTSFFVTDYTEVDDNVTRHLSSEIHNADFDTLILHYLGLDHIGHLAGPKSPLVRPKLQEMDQIIKDIYKSVQKYNDDLPSLFVLCGDHGMSDQGSHGGASVSETLVPVVFFSPHQIFGRKDAERNEVPEIEQIDVVPTLAVLLGLPIPQNNLGKLIDDMLHGFTLQQKVLAWYTNAYQVSQVFQKNVPNYEQDPAFLAYERCYKSHSTWLFHLNGTLSPVAYKDMGIRISQQYKTAVVAMATKISSSLTKYDMYGLNVGIVALLMVLSVLLFHISPFFIFYNWLTFSFILIGCLFGHVTVCTSQSGRDSLLCGSDVQSLLLQNGLILIVVFFTSCFAGFLTQSVSKTLNIKVLIWQRDWIGYFLIFGTVLHTLSLGSSSFVEEEHQTCYFYVVTIHFILMIRTIRVYCEKYNHQIDEKCQEQYFVEDMKKSESFENSQQVLLSECEILGQDSNLRLHKNQSRLLLINNVKKDMEVLENDYQYVNMDPNKKTSFCHKNIILGCVCIIVLCRILRSWNQTGNKWLDTPDVGDWLVRPENKLILSATVLVSLVLISLVQCRHMMVHQKVIFGSALMCTYWYRATTGTLISPLSTENISKGVLEARLGFCATSTFILMNFIRIVINKNKEKSKSSVLDIIETLQKSWILLMVLLVRPHNIPMVAMVTIQEFIIHEYIFKHMQLSVPILSLYYLWMGQSTFFYQGNSNSISTVDVSAGYIGLDDYQPVIVATLLTLSTYTGIIFWMLSLVKVIIRSLNSRTDTVSIRLKPSILEMCHTLVLSRVLPLSFYTVVVTLQRYHLFVWTVFSPKLLYEGMTTVVIYLFCILLMLATSL